MTKISTFQQNCVRSLYNETSLSEEVSLKNAFAEDKNLLEEFKLLHQAKQQLPKVLFNPSTSVLDRILNYSRETAAEPHC